MKSINILLAVFLTCVSDFTSGNENKVVFCYYASWAAYRDGLGRFEVTDIPVNLCTHVVYTFMGIDYSGKVKSLDPYLDYAENWGKDYLRKFNGLKNLNPQLKTILAVGGFNEGSEKYSLMAASPKLRNNFITTALEVVTKYGFDGLEVDWEYPNRENTVYGPEDVNNFSTLLKELREEFEKKGLLVTAAVAAVEQFAALSYNVSAISSYLDYVSIMAYDMYGPWDSKTGHNAPLHKGKDYENIPESQYYSVENALQYWLGQGCPSEKLVLGMPFYGRTFSLRDEEVNFIGAPSSGYGIAGPYTRTPGFLGYNEFCQKVVTEPWNRRQDDLAKVPYASNGKSWISYDDAYSLAAKVSYGLEFGIAGVMVWTIDTDDIHRICGGEDFTLLRSVNRALGYNV